MPRRFTRRPSRRPLRRSTAGHTTPAPAPVPPRTRRAALVPALAVVTAALIAASPQPVGAQDAIALAVAPLQSESEQATAKVIQKRGPEWVTLREGTGMFICIADDPSDDRFHSACYHTSLEPYMARGRELAAGGAAGGESLQTRIAEIEAGTLEMPSYAMLHSISAEKGWAGDMDAVLARRSVIYTPFATAEELGLPTRPGQGVWLMASGAANSHIMITP